MGRIKNKSGQDMIKRIKKIKNIAVFKDFNWDSNIIPDFKKYNAFYGWNGTGKTTIARILSTFEKCELGKLELDDDSLCVIEIDNSTLKLSKNDPIPDLLKNNIRVFNEDFVNENLDWVEGRASKILIMGKEQKKQRETLDSIIYKLGNKNNDLKMKEQENSNIKKEKNNILEKARNEIKENLREVNDIKPKSGRATDYINYTVVDVENILIKSDEVILIKDDEMLQLKNSLKEKETKELIEDIEIHLGWIHSIIEKSKKIFETIIPDEGLRLLSNLGNIDEKLKEWLRVGYEIHKEKQHPVICEFCKNEIPEKRIEKLGEYFSDVLINLIKNIDQITKDILRNELQNFQLKKEKFYSEFQNEFLNLSNIFNQQENIIRQELDKIKKILAEKKNNSSQKIIFDFNILNKSITGLENIIIQINSLIKKNNEKTNSFKEKRAEYAHNLESAIINKYKPDYDEKEKRLNELWTDIKSLSKEIEELKTNQNNIERNLKKHYFAAEEFNNLLRFFLGRSEISLETVEDGYLIKRNGKVASNLSESEKNTIALIYFLIKLDEENFDSKNGIIVIDDPVSSFDSQYLYGAFAFIKEKVKELNPQQVFIFTHNFPFFRLVRDWMKYEYSRKTWDKLPFYMIKSKLNATGRYSTLDKIDKLLNEYNSEYSYLFKKIYNRANTQDSSLDDDYIFPNAIRKFLENYISFKVPISGINIHEKLKNLCNDYYSLIEPKIKTQIESYCQDQSHPLYQDSPIDFDERLLGEIQEICSAIIELVKKTDPKHYQNLLKECGFSNNE
ncbi:MAG: AAA family ATPase [Actinobacteria bacterium]|nr:AAA family ATPase [Cyanobacteriota bacterium]MCL5770790.1 AAA family ATPase [Actinomycetota bacterium]